MHDILTINHKEIKLDAGRIKKKIANEMAEREYKKLDAQRKAIEASKSLKSLKSEVSNIKNTHRKK